MVQEFRLPDIGEGLTEAEIVRWLVAEGEYVAADQPVVEVETDKAVVEIPSPYAGIVLRHGGAAGEVLEVGAILLVVGDSTEGQETAPEPSPNHSADTPDHGPDSADYSDFDSAWSESVEPTLTEPMLTEGAAPIVGTLVEEAELLAPREQAHRPAATAIKALPIVRKLARDSGVDLSAVHGSGPEGRITREDVLAAAKAKETAGQPRSVVEESLEAVPQRAEAAHDTQQRMSRLRRTIASNMAKSWAEIPHVTTFDDVDATRLLEVRSALSERHQIKIPLEALVIKATIPAIERFPEFNATLDGENLVLHEKRDIGIAVDTPDGLLVAVVRDAVSKSVLELAAEVVRLGEGAKARSLGPDELSGQTFTVSNIGAVGGGHGTPIVPYGTTAILSVGRAKEKPIVEDGDLVIAPVMPLSLSYDHRVVDGGQGRRFMAMVIENLEEPALFLAG